MDLTQLKMFCAVADCGSMARAAQQLHRVPSNLTTRLRQLEEELGGNLFIREKQRLRLSPMGHNFLCYARRILLLSEEALSMTQASQPGAFRSWLNGKHGGHAPASAAGRVSPALSGSQAGAGYRHIGRADRAGPRRNSGRRAGGWSGEY